jgi:hypothetical protein
MMTAPLAFAFASPQEIVNSVIDKRFVALDVGLIDIEARRQTEQTLKSRDRRGVRRRHLVRWELRNHEATV